MTHEILLHPAKVGIWCTESVSKTVGPVVLPKQLIEKDMYRPFSGNRLYGWFQQDSATAPHCMQALHDVFRDGIISSFISPAHSPDLYPCDFFFWGCLKDKIYNTDRRTKKLKENIRREIANIPAEQNLFHPCEECLYIVGQHFLNLLLSVNCNYFFPNGTDHQAY
jgi:hypothetical protein